MNKITNINVNSTKVIKQKSVNQNQIKVANAFFTGKTKKLTENNNGELDVFESESNHSDEQKESNIARQKSAEQPNEQPGTTDMPDLESEESAVQGQSPKGLKILTPNQMLYRLPISLAKLNAGNNSVKLENEIRQLLHSLYR